MKPVEPQVQQKQRRSMENGRIYFSRDQERKFFFALTIVLLIFGGLFRIGVL